MAGHVFIVHADLTRLACDAWLMPCGLSGKPSQHWLSDIERDANFQWPELPKGWGAHGTRCIQLHHKRLNDLRGVPLPMPWLVNVGASSKVADVNWYVEGVEQFMACVSKHQPIFDEPLNQRARPLIALPMVGTGGGGMRHRAGEMVRALLPALYDAAAKYDFDVVLVAFAQADFTAAQKERRRYHQAGHQRWPALTPKLRQQADKLARRASEGELVVFVGSGTGVGAGLKTWGGFLRQIAQASPQAQALDWDALESWSYADQARLIARAFPSREALVASIIEVVSRRHVAMIHSQLASLPVQEFVTTNYDTLLEQASGAINMPMAVLPYDRIQGHKRWLLKLHGCVNYPEDIVLTRGDYLRYTTQRAALAGVVQALLITKHMLFVGFSLEDDNFHRMADDVRRIAVQDPNQDTPFGTSLVLLNRPLFQEFWKGEINMVALSEPNEEAEPIQHQRDAARRLEIFMDYMIGQVDHTAHLLNPRFTELLSQEEHALRALLHELIEGTTPEIRQTPAWHQIAQLLTSLGWEGKNQ